MSASRYAELVRACDLLIFVGQGGVGKTTCAAATALGAALDGRRVAVLTIDPAPRLGDALGLEHIDAAPQSVSLPDGAGDGGSLDAMRLDTEGTFDRMVERLAPDAGVARNLLDSPIYRAIAGSLGGSESYMALQRLHELHARGAYDLLVIDTPPAAHAAELLSAPSRLAALMDTEAAQILANPARILTRTAVTGSRILGNLAQALLGMLERVTGSALREQIAAFVSDFEQILTGLTARADAVERVLREPRTAFIHVVRPSPESLEAAATMERELGDAGYEIAHRIVNRMTPPRTASDPDPTFSVAGAPAGTSEAVAAMEAALDSLRGLEADAVATIEHRFAGRSRRRSAAGTSLLSALDHDVASNADLVALARRLAD